MELACFPRVCNGMPATGKGIGTRIGGLRARTGAQTVWMSHFVSPHTVLMLRSPRCRDQGAALDGHGSCGMCFFPIHFKQVIWTAACPNLSGSVKSAGRFFENIPHQTFQTSRCVPFFFGSKFSFGAKGIFPCVVAPNIRGGFQLVDQLFD